MLDSCRLLLGRAALVVLLIAAASRLYADETPASNGAATPLDFEHRIAPILLRHCAGCHNPADHAGDLNLLTKATAFGEGESGETAIKPGSIEGSNVIARIEAGEMPPEGKGKPLSGDELTALKSWIEAGAAWPEGRILSPFDLTTDARAGRDWWSLKPPVRPEPPKLEIPNSKSEIRNPIDAFVAKRLQEAGLSMSAEADRATLIRRAQLDLLGLPPSPEEVNAFVADPSPDAYERLIDRLLASPHYGERWARHWLDVVRFAESAGFETNLTRANAWPFRDYVIESFNADKPFTQFITEQLAGDQVGADVATSYLVAGPSDAVKSPDIELTLMQRMGELDDMVSTTSTAFLGLTAGCAKCHDHKFDPISQRDYYALQGIFAGVQHGEREIRPAEPNDSARQRDALQKEIAATLRARDALAAQSQPLAQLVNSANPPKPARPSVHALGNIDRFAPVNAKFVRFTVRGTNGSEPCIDELEVFTAESLPRNVALASSGAVVTASSVFANGTFPIHQIAHINDGRFGNSFSWISNEAGKGWVQIELKEPAVIDRVAWARDRDGTFGDRLAIDYLIEVASEPGAWRIVASSDDRRPYDAKAAPEGATPGSLPAEAAAQYAKMQAKIDSLGAELAKLQPLKAYVGNFNQPDPTFRLHRGEPMQKREEVKPGAIATVGKPLELESKTPEAQRRVALAKWIADESNPLTARVMVNRIWHYHFGQGLMRNPSDFGFNGGTPSHPELLDWLATEFMAGGWRPKHIHRLIMLSSTYRQSSKNNPQAAAVDGGNTLLWRYSPRRLEAEPIRDTVLCVTGSLDLKMGGPGFDVFEPNGNYVKVYIPKTVFGPTEWRRMVYQQKPRMQADATFGAFDCPDSAQPLARRNASTTALQALNLLNGPFMMQQADMFASRLERESPQNVAKQVERAFWLAFGRAPDAEEQNGAEALIAAEGLPIFCRAMLNSNELIYLQ